MLLAAPAAADATKRVRVFAVGPKFHLSWVDSREHFRGKLFALMDKRERGAGAPLVQRDADDVASHLLGSESDLVALPEDIGLMAAFTGSRGRPAREVAGDLTQSIASLLVTYSPQVALYGTRYPATARRTPQVRTLALALTDTFGRVAVETFAELADRYDVWLEAGVNMAQDWRIVCRSLATYRPPAGGEPCRHEDAGLVSLLQTTDEDRDYAYEAITDQPVNMALVFGPDGRLVSKQVKTYITPTELPGQLDLVPGDVSEGLSLLDTPVGKLGFVTSKDAWMPDVTQRMDQAGVEILVQPEFFVGDTVGAGSMWAPDNLRASGPAALLRHPSIHTLVLPELTGNVYDFSADAQQHIAVDPARGKRGLSPFSALVGQDPFPGFVKVQPWVVGDPAGAEGMAERRTRLAAAGAALLPGSGVPCPDPQVAAPCEGGQPEGVLWHDVAIGPTAARPRPVPTRKRGVTRFSASRAFTRLAGTQRNVTLAARGERVYAAFEVGDRLALMASSDSGRRWRRLGDPVRRPARQWWPSLSLGPDGRLWLAWCDDSTGVFRAYFATRRPGRGFTKPRPLAAVPDARAPQLRPSIAATGAGSAVAAWVDERELVGVEVERREAGIFTARLTPAGPAGSARLDTGEPVALAQSMDHSWWPSVAARGERVLVTWLDHRTYDWRVYSRESTDGGTTFAEQRIVDHAPADVEVIADRPQAAFTSGGDPLLAFTDYRKRDTRTVAHPLHDVAVASPGAAPRQVDTHGPRQVSSFAPALLPAGRATLVAWQDHARGDGDILIRSLRSRSAHRVDDAGSRAWNAWRPTLAALPGGRVLAAWEDDRDGVPRIRYAHARVGALR